MRPPAPERTGVSEEPRAERTRGRSREALKKQVGNEDPMTVARWLSLWESESRFEMPAPDRRDAEALASQDLLLSKEAAESITR